MNKETSSKSIYAKLLEVQKEVKPIEKTESNPFFNSKYFDVNAILAALKPILTRHSLVLTQPFMVETTTGRNALETVLTDSETGEHINSLIYLPETSDPQKFGSAVTYYRRYALQSLFALEAEDDDANVATGKQSVLRQAAQPARTWTPPSQGTTPATPLHIRQTNVPAWKPKAEPKEDDGMECFVPLDA